MQKRDGGGGGGREGDHDRETYAPPGSCFARVRCCASLLALSCGAYRTPHKYPLQRPMAILKVFVVMYGANADLKLYAIDMLHNQLDLKI